MEHCSIACTCKKKLVPHCDFFSTNQQKLFHGAKKMSLQHGNKIDQIYFAPLLPGQKLLHWNKKYHIIVMLHCPPRCCIEIIYSKNKIHSSLDVQMRKKCCEMIFFLNVNTIFRENFLGSALTSWNKVWNAPRLFLLVNQGCTQHVFFFLFYYSPRRHPKATKLKPVRLQLWPYIFMHLFCLVV